jgi:hypothetical protein
VCERFLNSEAAKLIANSSFHNILRASHSASRFCRECHGSTGPNLNRTRILQSSEEKNVAVRLRGEQQQVPPGASHSFSGMRSCGRDDNLLKRNAVLKHRSSTAPKKGGLCRPPFSQTRTHKTPDDSTPAAGGRAGSGIAESSRPAPELELIHSAQRCGPLLRGRRPQSPTIRQFPAEARD